MPYSNKLPQGKYPRKPTSANNRRAVDEHLPCAIKICSQNGEKPIPLQYEPKIIGDTIYDPYNGYRRYDPEEEALKKANPIKAKIYDSLGLKLKDDKQSEVAQLQVHSIEPWDESKHPRDDIGRFAPKERDGHFSVESASTSEPDITKTEREIYQQLGIAPLRFNNQKETTKQNTPDTPKKDVTMPEQKKEKLYEGPKRTEAEESDIRLGKFAKHSNNKQMLSASELGDSVLPGNAVTYLNELSDRLPTRMKVKGEKIYGTILYPDATVMKANKGHLQSEKLTVSEAITQNAWLGASTECAGVVQGLYPYMGLTSDWRGEMKVMDNLEDIPIGTPIATFTEAGKKGKYGNKHDSHKHAAIYLGKGVKNEVKGFWVLDQWNGQPLHVRFIQANDNKPSWSNNANAYYVITVPK